MAGSAFVPFLIGLAMAGLVLPPAAAAAERPSFDCTKAASATEKAICGNDRLARLDRAIAQAFRALRSDPNLAERLAEEQAAFLKKRDACNSDTGCLAREMESRRAALALEPLKDSKDARERFVGRYRGALGEMIVRRTLAGEFEIDGSTAEPSGRWVCDVSGNIQSVSKDVATVKGDDGGESFAIFLRLSGDSLTVTEDPENRLAGRLCGHNGTVEGRYRRAPGGR